MAKILKSDSHERIDIFLAKKLSKTRSFVQKMIRQGIVKVNGKVVEQSYKLKIGDTVELGEFIPEKTDLKAEDKPLKILYEDKYLLVVDKEAGVTVHPVGSKNTNTLVNRLLFYIKDLSAISGTIRPGIVHRLDKDTSGVLIVAKNNEAHLKLSEMLKKHDIDRRYIALIKGLLDVKHGKIDIPLGRVKGETKMKVSPLGRRAITHFRVIEEIGPYSLVAVRLETGRTHQIRVHFSYIGHPVVGDSLYGGRVKEIPLKRQFLHAYEISFVHPIMKKKITVYSHLPDDLMMVLEELRDKWKKKK
jgi:23S rRNA pseudouridine1911/1915/1917 synthase